MGGSIGPDGEKGVAGTLPHEIVRRIMGRVSFSTMVVAKAVCKQWNAAMASPEYIQSMAEMHSLQPWFCILCKETEQSIAYDPMANTWHSLVFPSLPSHLQYQSHLSMPSSIWGFVANIKNNPAKYCLAFCKPFGKAPWIELPLRVDSSFALVLLSGWHSIAFVNTPLHDTAASFSIRTVVIIWASPRFTNTFELKIDIYQSESINAWRDRIESVLPIRCWIENSVICNGIFYCSVLSIASFYSVLVYYISDAYGTELSAPMPCSFTKMVLLNCKERLIMVGGIQESDDDRSCKGIGIWELNDGREEWIEVDTMPMMYFKKIGANTDFNACGSGELIYFHWIEGTPVRLLLFIVPERRWQWIKCPSSRRFSNYHLHPFSFEPT